MIKKVMGWKTKGMNRDLSVSAFNPEFSFENINLRLITNEGNTAMSWVNERGTKTLEPEITINEDTKENTIYGITIGTAVLNQYLVIFTTAKDYDRIYRLEYDKTAKTPKKPLTGVLLFKGNLGFSADYPLETLASYETDAVQKVYWVDGKHQPRVINIVSDKSAYLNNSYTDTSFDFVQELKLQENVAIQKQIGAGGMFAPGVIQYAFTYFNKNGQESNIFYTSPLLYISHADRGASPEDRVANAFKIKVTNIEKSFDYIRIYSLQRTSINGTPMAKRVQDISIASLPDLDENAKSYNSCYAIDTILSIKKGEEDLSSFHFEDIGAGQNQEEAVGGSQAPFVKQLNEQNSQYLFCGTGNNNNPNPDTSHLYGWLGFRLKSYKDTNSEIVIETFDSKITFKSDATEDKINNEDIRLYDTANLYSLDTPETASVPMIWISCLMTRNANNGWDVVPTKLKGNYGTKYYIVTTSQVVRKAKSAGEGEPIIGYSYKFNSSEEAVTDNLMQSEGFSFSFIDTGTVGDSIDPAELLYKGGQSIVAGTMDQKDNTLFLGNIHLSRPSLQNLSLSFENKPLLENAKPTSGTRSFIVNNTSNNDYTYGNQLSAQKEDTKKSVSCGGFKRGEIYRLGIQFQYKDGSWSEPKYLADVEETEKPEINLNQTKVTVPTFKYSLPAKDSIKLINAGFRRARALVVFPDITDRKILCQGVVNSTLYTDNTDINNKHQASWFFRPNGGVEKAGTEFTPTSSGTLPYTQGGPANNGSDKPVLDSASLRKTEVQGKFNEENQFIVDNQLWSFNTPELDYEEAFPVLDFTGTTIQQVGTAVFNKTFSSIYLQTESPAISSSGAGFTKRTNIFNAAKGFISGLFYDDYVVNDYEEEESSSSFGPALTEGASVKWLVYPWQRNGSLNNDFERSGSRGNRSAVLKKKVLSNLRYSTTDFSDKASISLSQNTSPTLFNSDQIDIVKVGDIVYQGNIDTALVSDGEEGMYFAYTPTDFSPTEQGTTDFGDNIDWMTWSLNAIDNKGTGLWSHKRELTYHTQRQEGTVVKEAGWYDGENLILKITEPDIADGTKQVRWFWYNKQGIRPGWYYRSLVKSKPLVRMKYKSSPHLVFKVNNEEISPYEENGLKICEILSSGKDDATRFGGTTADALQANVWIPCGEPVALDSTKAVDVLYSYGDTYFQRWDCLKTSPLNSEDTNQIVEIGSFMLETRLNIDGRYDRNRGLLDNTNINDRNFNLYNPVYSQINNFFSYKIMPDDYYQNTYYKNQITWTLTKQSGVDVDPWTNITLASTMELDGDKGPVNKIIRLNDQLLVFQDTGISQLLYNENTQISTTAGVPIEIANSGKVQGKRYISNNIGCINKWSIVTTPMGIYFIDSIGKNIHLFNGQLANISSAGGFNSWCKANIPDPKVKGESEAKEWLVWTPDKSTDETKTTAETTDKKETVDEFVGYYDRNNQDVLFINNSIALAWSEKFQTFTSFYDYGAASYFCNLNASGIWLVNGSVNGSKYTSIFEHQAGEDYCKFFEANKPYGMTLVANPDAQLDKTFSNLEFRANVDNDGTWDKDQFTPYLPFDELEVWNDYQHGMSSLENKRLKNAVLHPDSDGSSALRRKFRIWRCDIPRDNAPCSEEDKARDKARGIFRIKSRPLDRMRNPWLYIKLMKKAKETENLGKVEIHDMVLDYYI